MEAMQPDEFKREHPEAARFLGVGERVLLFTINEHEDREGPRFTATVEEINVGQPPIIRISVRSDSYEPIRRIVEDLRSCAEARDCGVHIEVSQSRPVAPGGAAIASHSPGIVLKPIVLEEARHAFVPIHVGPVADDGTLLPGEYSLRFSAHLID